MFYSRGEVYEEHIIYLPFIKITIATQSNISGTYTKYIELPGFYFGRNYMGAQLNILGIRIFNTVSTKIAK